MADYAEMARDAAKRHELGLTEASRRARVNREKKKAERSEASSGNGNEARLNALSPVVDAKVQQKIETAKRNL